MTIQAIALRVQHPLVVTVLVTLLITLWFTDRRGTPPAWAGPATHLRTSVHQSQPIADPLAVLAFCRLCVPTSWRSLWLFLPLVVLALLPLIRGIPVNLPTLLALTIISLLVAFWKASVNNESESWPRSPLVLVLPDVLPALVLACSGRRDGGDTKGAV